jgi:hypothetical protein
MHRSFCHAPCVGNVVVEIGEQRKIQIVLAMARAGLVEDADAEDGRLAALEARQLVAETALPSCARRVVPG